MLRRVVAFAAVLVVSALVTQHAYASTTTDIANLALANVGKKACSTNSLGGKDYETSCTGNGGSPEYWCADFAQWVWANTGVNDTSQLDAAAGSFYVYGQNHGTLHNSPAIGDAVVFDYQGGGVADHVAIVTQVNGDGTIETVSGDWNGDSGTEAEFASTSQVVLNTPAYAGTVGSTPNVMGMTISGFIAPVGVSALPPLQASFVAQGSDAPEDPTKAAYYSVCTGATFHFWFEVENTGAVSWTDVSNTAAGDWGKAVRLQTSDGKADVLAGVTQVSVNENANTNVDPKGGSCDDKSGCNSTRFTSTGIAGKAPSEPGIYKTSWQLVDDGRGTFGPTMWLTYDVAPCAADAGPLVTRDGAPPGTDGGDASPDDGSSGGCSLSHSSRTSGMGSVAVLGLLLMLGRRRQATRRR